MQVRDLESGRHATIDLLDRGHAGPTPPRPNAAVTILINAFYKVPIEHIFVPTDDSPVEPLLSFFTRRLAR